MGDRAKHTAGPWVVSRKLEVGPRSDADDQSFGMVVGVCDVYGDNAEADARLIAAAPDLLDALREARETILQLKNSRWSECEGSDAEWVGGLDVAISRATGEA